MRAPLTASLAFWGLVGCAFFVARPNRLPDGSYRVSCDGSLSRCLDPFDQICEWHGYDVISASESRRHSDLREVPTLTVVSEAHIRCKPGEPLLGTGPRVAPAAPTPAP